MSRDKIIAGLNEAIRFVRGENVDANVTFYMPMNEYQMGNLVAAFGQAIEDGDWYGEILNMIAHAMRVANITELRANNGRTFTLAQVEQRDIR